MVKRILITILASLASIGILKLVTVLLFGKERFIELHDVQHH